MAFETFHFKDFTGFGTPKLWSRRGIDDEDESLALFSSVETDETTVRSDMQMLFSQLKTGLNKILGHVTNAIDAVRKSEETLVTEKAVVDYMTALGNGDMAHAVYDADEAVKDAGGIKAFVNSSAGAAIADHAADSTIHITAAERTTWNSKANGTHSHQTSDVAGLDTALAGKSDSDHTHESIDNSLAVDGNITATGRATADEMSARRITITGTDELIGTDATNKAYVDNAIYEQTCHGVSYGEVTVSPTPVDLELTSRHTAVGFYTYHANSSAWYGTTIPLIALNADTSMTFGISVGGGGISTYTTVKAKKSVDPDTGIVTLHLEKSGSTTKFVVYGF